MFHSTQKEMDLCDEEDEMGEGLANLMAEEDLRNNPEMYHETVSQLYAENTPDINKNTYIFPIGLTQMTQGLPLEQQV